MVNIVAAAVKLFQYGLMKYLGFMPRKIELEPGTVLNIWVPTRTIKNPKKTFTTAGNTKTTKPAKRVVVLIHGFCADGIFTWLFQMSCLRKKYSVYVPDLLFFGGSITDNPDRSPMFQAECLVKGLRKLGIKKCTVVGFSYGGTVGFKMAEQYHELVEALVISGSVPVMMESISIGQLKESGFSTLSELLLPNSVEDCKALLKVAIHKNIWFLPDRFFKDFIKVMYNNRKERAELLEQFIVSNDDTTIPRFTQKIHLLWGENDQLFKLELAKNLEEQLGDKTTFQGIRKAGHLAHVERPFVYNRCLKQYLDSLDADDGAENDA